MSLGLLAVGYGCMRFGLLVLGSGSNRLGGTRFDGCLVKWLSGSMAGQL